MLDLKNCPFCGGKPTVRRVVEEYHATQHEPAGEYDAEFLIQCDDCRAEQREEYRSDAIAAWNRRALQAVGPEPVNFANGPVMAQLPYGEFLSWIADRMVHIHGENPNFDYILRLREIAAWLARSALVATTPAETVVEARTHPLEIYADSYAQMARMGDGKVDCRSVEIDIRQNMIPVTTALATKPAVKDDETVVEALEIARGYILRSNNHWKDDDLAKINAALAAKDGRS